MSMGLPRSRYGRLRSSPHRRGVSVGLAEIQTGVWTPPYTLPGVGAAQHIGTNTIQSVRPATHSAHNWAYSTFGAFGSGCFIPATDGGKYAVAGSGGHNAPSNINCLYFDFSDGLWKFRANANGVAELNNTGGLDDWNEAETTLDPHYLITGTDVPAPAHPYATSIGLSAAQGGGNAGSYLYVSRAAVCVESRIARGAYRFDIDSGIWSVFTPQVAGAGPPPWASFDATAIHDEQTQRAYLFSNAHHSFSTLHYLDLQDGNWKSHGSHGFPPTLQGANYMLDTTRRLILAHVGTALRAINLDSPTAWVTLAVSGTLEDASLNHWCYHPTHQRFYRCKRAGGNTLERLVAPAADPLVNSWTVDEITVTGDTIPPYGDDELGTPVQTSPHRALIYVSSLDRLAWISGNSAAVAANEQVTLINPAVS